MISAISIQLSAIRKKLKMRIIFFGSSDFALPSLRALLENGENIICVVTQPDRKKGRHLKQSYTPIKEFAVNSNLCVYQPEKASSNEARDFIVKFPCDLFVVIAYGQILSRELLDIPSIMPLNVHASFLPFYRGAAPINRAIIDREKETGITIIKMTACMDAGPIIMQEKIAIAKDDDFFSLERRLSLEAAGLLIRCLSAIRNNDYTLALQDESKITFAAKLKKQDGLIDWNLPAVEIDSRIRGCIGWPGAFTYYKGKLLKIFKVRVSHLENLEVCPLPGKIAGVFKGGIAVITGKDILSIEELQLEGKRRMQALEFIAGNQIEKGEMFGIKACVYG